MLVPYREVVDFVVNCKSRTNTTAGSLLGTSAKAKAMLEIQCLLEVNYKLVSGGRRNVKNVRTRPTPSPDRRVALRSLVHRY